MLVPNLLGVGAFAITPDDDNDLDAPATGGVYVGTAGRVKFTAVDGTTDEWSVPAGGMIPVAIVRVFATVASGTIADDLHAVKVV